ncbi:MAG: hypothetical protein J0H72_12555 [Burkholderiales bacterium]|nr:hypothetical protein [Burkholderiales bacterium]
MMAVDDLVRELKADLERYAAFGDMMSGGAGDLAAADWIAERMAGMGYAVARQAFDIPCFEPAECTLTAGGFTATLHAQPPVTSTSPAGLAAPLAVVRSPHDAGDARGRIALIVLPHGRHASMQSPAIRPLVQAAAKAGAVALVIVPVGPTGRIMGLNCNLEEPVAPLPVGILAPAELEPFLAAARSASPATLVLHGRGAMRPTCNVHGVLDRGPRWVALSTPRTGWFGCVSERGTGTAAFLALAEWVTGRFPAHSVFFMNSGAHEYHFAGAHRAMRFAPPPGDTDVWVHLGASLATRGHIEFRGLQRMLGSADSNRILMTSDRFRDAASEAFAGLSGLECPAPVLGGVSELATILSRGYEGFAVLGMPRAFHTREDTLDTVDAGLLAPVVRAHMALMEAVVTSPRQAWSEANP